MRMIKNTKIGDVFVAQVNETQKKYFQYMVSDLEQLNSDVIRVFKTKYDVKYEPSLIEIISDEIDFYAHTTTKTGIKLGLWKLYGNIIEVGNFDKVLFCDTDDLGDPSITISKRWWVWNINKERKYIGKLTEKYQKAEIGLVYAPHNIMSRLQGTYVSYYPRYE